MKNTYGAKLLRIACSLFPVAKNRKGECKKCGACCSLPNKCLFLRNNKCIIYPIRFPSCRKYPRCEEEHITKDKCGFRFE